MLNSFLVLAIRNFFKNLSYSIINLFGLSIGLATFIMLSLFVRFESSYDTYHEDHERIYRVIRKVNTANGTYIRQQLPAPYSIELENGYAEVEDVIVIRRIWGEYLSTSKERTFYEKDGSYANPDIFDLFKINFIAGNKETALDGPMKIVLTKTLANKLFPDLDPMGQNILVDSKRSYQVSAVIEDFPYNTYGRSSYLIPFETYKSVYNEDLFEFRDRNSVRVYLKLKEKVNEKTFESKIKNSLDEFIDGRDEEIQLKPLWMFHLNQGGEDGYWIAILMYGTLGLFTLVLAAINFVNLTTAYSLTRAKEIGVKKILGCLRINLMKQFLGESLIMIFISLLVAFTITEATLPLFNRIVSVPLDLKYIEDWRFTLFIIGITCLAGLLSGLYPALVLSSINPLSSIKNQLFESNRFKKFSMRRGLIVFQLVISILFVLTTLNILGQFKYLQNKDLGFDKNNLLICRINSTEKVKSNKFSALRDALLQIPDVEETSLSYNTPFYGSSNQIMNWEGAVVGENMNCKYNRAYATFIKTLKIKLLAGRDFDVNRIADSTACIVNESFVNSAGWDIEEAVGKRIWDLQYTIIGVVKDFHVESPFLKIRPYILFKHTGYLTGSKSINIRVIDVSNKETIKRIKIILEDFFPESNFELNPFDENANDDTNKVFSTVGRTFGFFSVISIVIAIVGLFALVSFSSKRKVKEIGIRKALGASSFQIYKKLTKEYIILIVIANAIAIPIGIMMKDIDPSYYKTSLNYFNYLYTILGSIVLTVLTISIQIINSSNSNPVDSLRYE